MGSSSIGQWIKERLDEAGVDVSTLSAHSTRGASASYAAAAGVAVESILRNVDWANASTFARF